MKKYDFLIVGAGLYGATFANLAVRQGLKCLLVERRNHVGGNAYTENINGINVHKYGAHIFHTSSKDVWDYVSGIAPFNHYTHSVLANYKGNLYNLPFNMNTFYSLWKTNTPDAAFKKIQEQRQEFSHIQNPSNLEEQALILGGRDIYEKLVKGYSEKQWGRKASEIPAFVIRRLPFRFTFDNNYYNDPYQGIPIGGYTQMIDKMLEGVDVLLNCNYLQNQAELSSKARKTVYTGALDEYFDYCFGALEYRSLRFECQEINTMANFQGCSVVNYTDAETPYTRIIEHKHFEFGNQPNTVITYEYSTEWQPGEEPYYPVNDDKNAILYSQYKALADKEKDMIFGGRLAEYKYYDMDKVIEQAMKTFTKTLSI